MAERLVFQKILVASLSSEDLPLLEPVLGVLLVVGAHLQHLVFLELIHTLQLKHGPQVLVFLPLRVQHLTVPLSDFLHDSLVAQLLKVESVVAERSALVVLLLVAESSEVEVNSHLGDDFVVELSPDPNAEFGPSWKDSESLGNISDCPALEVQLIDGINCPWGKSCIVVFLLIPRVY